MKPLALIIPALTLTAAFAVNAKEQTPTQSQQERITPDLQQIAPDSVKRSCDFEREIFTDLQVHIDDKLYLDPVCAKA